jgi:hypothetical protein
MKIDFPCTCSHSKGMHNPIKWKNRKGSAHCFKQDACYAEYYNFNDNDNLCKCREYKPDNLKYLEMLSEQAAN